MVDVQNCSIHSGCVSRSFRIQFNSSIIRQIFGNMVANEMSNNKKTSTSDNPPDMAISFNSNNSMGDILRSGTVQRLIRHRNLHRSMAELSRWSPLLPNRKHDVLLHIPDDIHDNVLHINLHQGVETSHTDRSAKRANGKNTTKIQRESGQNVSSCRYTVRGILVTFIRDIRKD